GYTHRRLRLEAARYATVRAEAMLAARAARGALATVVTASDAPVTAARLSLSDTLVAGMPPADADSLVSLALRSRAVLRALALDAEAAAAGARLTARERTPVPVLTAGFKNESVAQPASGNQSLGGFAAGMSVPLPVFDRRRGSQDAADAEARRLRAEVEVQRRKVIREVADAHDAYNVAQEQVALLAPALGAEARAALTSAEVAYAEGEVTLVEWLDAVRAYREAESSFAALQGELLVRRAALERAVGAPLTLPTGGARIGAPQE
nr:TolC family protein [Gemmatimonadaceae bacterium]